MTTELKNEIYELRKNSKIAFISSVDEDGCPTIKAMLVLENENLNTLYFSTNLSAKRTQQFLKNPNAAVYLCETDQFKGLLLQGKIAVMTDSEHKSMLWREGFEIYYPDGIETEDYCVLKFIAEKGNYYHGLNNVSFSIQEVSQDGI